MRWMLAAVALFAAPAGAQPTCPSTAFAPGFAPGQAPLAAGLTVGRTVELALRPAGTVGYPLPLTRPAVPGATGGAFPLRIAAGGAYRITLSAKAWIDVVRDGATLDATDHAHGPPCSGIAKTVAFRLEQGDYVVQLSEAAARSIVVRVTRDGTLPGR